jgi:regulator of RNase E activity RraA
LLVAPQSALVLRPAICKIEDGSREYALSHPAQIRDAVGAVAPDIKPVITDQASFCGVAVTCHVGPADNLAVFAALPLLQAGDVI